MPRKEGSKVVTTARHYGTGYARSGYLIGYHYVSRVRHVMLFIIIELTPPDNSYRLTQNTFPLAVNHVIRSCAKWRLQRSNLKLNSQ